MRILITGNLGYVGAMLVGHLRSVMPTAEIFGYDSGFFAHCLTGVEALPETHLTRQYYGDVRDISPELLDGVDAVVHLAAVSNDPMGNRFEQVTDEINAQASLRLARLAREAGVARVCFRLVVLDLWLCRGRPAAGRRRSQSADRLCPLEGRDRTRAGRA